MSSSWNQLLHTMQKLRSPEGCPWDRAQTHQSIKHNLVEETYECLEAIDEADETKLKEELGDLLLQVVFHAKISEDSKKFTIDDVIGLLNDKLIRRHPHVFGDEKAKTPQEALGHWTKSKQKEKKSSHLEGVPKMLPALQRAQRISHKASSAGFDWDTIDDVWKKFEEEIQEVKEAIQKEDKHHIEKEMGDVLFTFVNIARKLGIESEDALRMATHIFETRFKRMEEKLKLTEKSLNTLSAQEKLSLWNSVK